MNRPSDRSDSPPADKPRAALPPEDERRRIIAEEEYRKAVAAQVDRQFSPRYVRFARHLNEPIVLWVLSTVFVGLVSLAYKEWQDNRQHRTEEIEVGRKASAELYFRISGCDAIGPNSDREDVETLLSSVIGLRPLYSEYQGQRLDAVYLTACLLGRNCAVPPDSVLSSTERIRRVLKPIIARTPTGTPLPTRSFLPQVRRDCERLLPVRDSIKSLMDRPVVRASFWKRMFD